jgi:hypothetical protein
MVDTGSSLTARRTEMKNVPYTTKTGVQIGIRYNESPKPMPIDDSDMIAIQGWFICGKEWHKQRTLETIVMRASAGVLALVILGMWITK